MVTFDKDAIPTSVMEKIRPLVNSEGFDLKRIKNASEAAFVFASWVGAMEKYDTVLQIVKPKRDQLAQSQKILNSKLALLNEKMESLNKLQAQLDALNANLQAAEDKKNRLQEETNDCSIKLVRAEKLISGLSGEKKSWNAKAHQLRSDLVNVVGDMVVSSGVIAYLGPYTIEYRKECETAWVSLLNDRKIPCSDNFSLRSVLGEDVEVQQWQFNKLPKDSFSVENAIIMKKSIMTPLIIDPQEQANTWLRNQWERKDEKDRGQTIKIMKPNDERFAQFLSACVTNGVPVMIENVAQDLDPMLEPLLLKSVFKSGRQSYINLGGENPIVYDDNFRLFITTKMHNPHYVPEISTKVVLINFSATPRGLEDQMLGTVVSVEAPDTERKLNHNIKNAALNASKLHAIEQQILSKLSAVTGNILDDEALVNDLNASKLVQDEIKRKNVQEKKSTEEINLRRAQYKGLANNVANLYFCIASLAQIDPMYQFSLQFFIDLFIRATDYDGDRGDIEGRCFRIERNFKNSLYTNVQRSLFARDKLLFSFLLYLQIQRGRDNPPFDNDQLRFFLTGGTLDLVNLPPNPTESRGESKDGPSGPRKWLSDICWAQMQNLGKMPAFTNLIEHFRSKPKFWKMYYESPEPFSVKLPETFSKWSPFERLCVLRCLRPDKVSGAMRMVIVNGISKHFVTVPPFDLNVPFQEWKNNRNPIVFILSPGVDPKADILALADEKGFNSPGKLSQISLGEGQEPIAEAAIREAVEHGNWVILQNCHLLVSFLPTLEKIIDTLDDTTHDDFRLWLTSMPTPDFPVSILQNSIKLTNEPPKGIKANVVGSLSTVTPEWFTQLNPGRDDSLPYSKPDVLSRLHFGLCFFHAIVQERRKFGPLGWNRVYEFNNSDLTISRTQLKTFLHEHQEGTPYQALHYLIGELNYGGRVTDDWDRRNINCILRGLVSDGMFEPDQQFDPEGLYRCPHPPEGTTLDKELDLFRSTAAAFPPEDSASVFGLHDNVNIATAVAEAERMFETILLTVGSDSSGDSGLSRDETVTALALDIEGKMPPEFDLAAARAKYPVIYTQSMNTVLVQELMRYNKLINMVMQTLSNLRAAIRGDIVMSSELDIVANDLFNGKVPRSWRMFRTCKPLAAWVIDLLNRLAELAKWIVEGNPPVYWMSGFFFTQSFLTGTLQNFARKYKIPINELKFDFKVMQDVKEDHQTPADDGCYVHGLFMAGARWDRERWLIGDSYKRVLYDKMPVIWLKPRHVSQPESFPSQEGTYVCPVYNSSERRGTLTTTGVSDNYVVAVVLPSDKPEEYWTRRAVACLCQLDY
jgi:dynein heavy chain